MVDSEYSAGNYKSSSISIRAKMKNSEMLKFVPDHLKTKKMCKDAVNKLSIVIRYVLSKYKTKTCVIKLF